MNSAPSQLDPIPVYAIVREPARREALRRLFAESPGGAFRLIEPDETEAAAATPPPESRLLILDSDLRDDPLFTSLDLEGRDGAEMPCVVAKFDGDRLRQLDAECAGWELIPGLGEGGDDSPEASTLRRALTCARRMRELEEENRRLTRRAERLAIILDENMDASLVVDETGAVRYLNPAATELFDVPADVLHGQPFGFPLVDGQTTEIDVFQGRGRRVVAEMRTGQIEWEGAPAWVVSLRDISARRKAEEERRRLERQMRETQKFESVGVLAGGIAHDFNNLLMVILGNASLALTDLPRHSPLHECIEQIEKSAQRGADLTSQLLTYAGMEHYDFQKVDLGAEVEEATRWGSAAPPEHVQLSFDFEVGSPPIEGDPAQLRRAIVNLLTNAIEAIDERPGKITITTGHRLCHQPMLDAAAVKGRCAPGPYVYVEVADDGPGMTEETVARAFDPFFSTKFAGRGLGLAAVAGIVRGHDAAAFLDSAPDRGTRVTLLFPVAGEAPALAPPKAEPVHAARPRPTVLLVEDEEWVRTTAQRMLEHAGYEVVPVSDGVAAIERFAEAPDRIDLVLLDMTMPRMNGEEAALRMLEIAPDTRIVVMSGYTLEEAQRRFGDTPLVGFLHKPFQLTDLTECLGKAFASPASPGTPADSPTPP